MIVGSAEIEIRPLMDRFGPQTSAGVDRVLVAEQAKVLRAEEKFQTELAAVRNKQGAALLGHGGTFGPGGAFGIKAAEQEVAAGASRVNAAFSGVFGAAKQRVEKFSAEGAAALERFGLSGVTAGSVMGAGIAAGFAAAALAVVGFIKAGVGHFQEITAEVRSFQRVTGAGAEDASRFVAVFNLLGVGSEKAATALFRLGKQIEIGKDGLAKFGIEIDHTAGGNVDLTQTFLNIADAVHEAGAGATSSAIAFQAFGRQGIALLPVLLRGREGLEDLFAEAEKHHLVFSQEDIDKGKELTLATRTLHETFVGLEVEAGQKLVPALTRLAIAATRVLEVMDRNIKVVRVFAAIATAGASEAVIRLIGAMDGGSDSAEALNADLLDTADSAEAAAAAIDKVATATQSLPGLSIAVEQAQLGYAASQRAVAEAEKDLAELRTGSPAQLKRIESATDALTKSTAALSKAMDEAAKADANLAKVRASEPQRLADLRARSDLRSRDAANSLADAIRAETRAEEDLAELRANNGPAQLERIAAAEERLTKAKEAAAQANESLTTAANDAERAQREFDQAQVSGDVHAQARAFERLNVAQQRQAEARKAAGEAGSAEAKAAADRAVAGVPDPRALEDAVEAVVDAGRQVEHAREGVADAANAQREAERQQREGSDELVAALAAQKSAHESLQTATGAHKGAVKDLSDAQADARATTDELAAAQARLDAAREAGKSAALAVVDAMVAYEIATREAKGETFDANDKLEIFRRNLQGMARDVTDGGVVDKALDHMIELLGGVTDAASLAAAAIAKLSPSEQAIAGIILGPLPGGPSGNAPITGSAGVGSLLVPPAGAGAPEPTHRFTSAGLVPVSLGAPLGTSSVSVDPQVLALLREIATLLRVDRPLIGSLTTASSDPMGVARSTVRSIRNEQWVMGR